MSRLLQILGRHFFRRKRKYASIGVNSIVPRSIKTSSPQNIRIGNNVSIGMNTWLDAMPLTGKKNCQLVINDGVTIGEYNHVFATQSVIFEEGVLTANFVYISDNLHGYENINTPIKEQPIKQLNPVVIGKGCWIGEHAAIIGASIGAHSIVGANAVVTHDIPDYCVAVGAPAYIIKRYDTESSCWKKTDRSGDYIEE